MSEQRVSVNISTTALIKIILVVLLLIALWAIRDILLVLLVSVVLASAMDPLVDWLYRKAKFPRGLSVFLVYLVFIGAVGLAFYFLVPALVTQFKELAMQFRGELATGADTVSRILNQLNLAEAFSGLGQRLASLTGDFFQTTLGVFSGIVRVIAVLAITFYLISSENGLKNFIRSLVPYKHKALAMTLTHKIQHKIGYWLLGQLILSTFIFVLAFLGLWILGVEAALPLALLAGLLEIVPYLGPTLSAIPAILVALTQSPPLALFVLLLYIVVQQVENYVLVPKIMGRTVGANPVVILLAVLVGFKLAGILGMLLAVPVVAAASVFISELREQREQQT